MVLLPTEATVRQFSICHSRLQLGIATSWCGRISPQRGLCTKSLFDGCEIELSANTKSELGATATSRTLNSWKCAPNRRSNFWKAECSAGRCRSVLILCGVPLRNHAGHFLCKSPAGRDVYGSTSRWWARAP